MHNRSKRASLSIIIALTLGVAAAAQTTAPASQPATSQSTLDPEVDQILTRLEGRQVQDLHARVAWRQEFLNDAPEDWLTKQGEIWYQRAEPVAKFLIRFTDKITGTRRDKLDEQHMFDGCWYIKVESRTKTVERHEIRRAADAVNPYKVGEGVFPLPFGQKKADILNEFDVTKVASEPSDPPNTDRLHLVPRQGTRTGQNYKQLDFWIDRDGPTAGLPLKVRVAKIDGTGRLDSHITITFSEVQLNTGFSGGIFDIKTPAGYTVTEERLDPIGPLPEK
jgi:hypothetical protein